mmetsp:Transcript_20046/g.60930  ORF Transcript_20046/g.60930 Transcript_20046/m.60930 type:complete len:211 (+) Transcript_20046:836-1468(+)|eukprot:scaffold193231_cov39-Tisochrysis_lutea.AAC.3
MDRACPSILRTVCRSTESRAAASDGINACKRSGEQFKRTAASLALKVPDRIPARRLSTREDSIHALAKRNTSGNMVAPQPPERVRPAGPQQTMVSPICKHRRARAEVPSAHRRKLMQICKVVTGEKSLGEGAARAFMLSPTQSTRSRNVTKLESCLRQTSLPFTVYRLPSSTWPRSSGSRPSNATTCEGGSIGLLHSCQQHRSESSSSPW